jgi:hypothetical protein
LPAAPGRFAGDIFRGRRLSKISPRSCRVFNRPFAPPPAPKFRARFRWHRTMPGGVKNCKIHGGTHSYHLLNGKENSGRSIAGNKGCDRAFIHPSSTKQTVRRTFKSPAIYFINQQACATSAGVPQNRALPAGSQAPDWRVSRGSVPGNNSQNMPGLGSAP